MLPFSLMCCTFVIKRVELVFTGNSAIENVFIIIIIYVSVCKHLSNGNFAIFGVSNASSMATIQSYTNTFKVPFVTFSMAQNTSSNESYQIYMRPIYVHAIVDLIFYYKWTKVYYIYDSDEGKNQGIWARPQTLEWVGG